MAQTATHRHSGGNFNRAALHLEGPVGLGLGEDRARQQLAMTGPAGIGVALEQAVVPAIGESGVVYPMQAVGAVQSGPRAGAAMAGHAFGDLAVVALDLRGRQGVIRAVIWK